MAESPLSTPRHMNNKVVAFPRTRAPRTWLVSANGAGDFGSISEAIREAVAGDTIQVGPGIYIESLYVDKAVHLVGPVDPRFVEEDFDADEEPYAMIMGLGGESIRWAADGGSIQNLFITRVTSGDDSDLTSALIRMRSGKIRIERCVMADGAHCAVASRGGDVEMIRCHVRNVPVGVCMLDTNVVMERNHVEGAEVLSLHVENGATASLKDNSFEGRTVLRGDIRLFQGNDIDTLFVHTALVTNGNRISSLVHVCDFRTEKPFAVGL
jgi:hypothetical protein